MSLQFSSENVGGTLEHKKRVGYYMNLFNQELFKRAVEHDYSKLSDKEHYIFEEQTKKLKVLTYGTEEYHHELKNMKPALDHHYAYNSHHPEYFDNGINGMSLLDIVEMTADWLAAVERHENGDIYKSLEINKDRFNIDNQLYEVLKNTIDDIKKDS